MYIRAAHAEADLRVLRRLIHENPLGMLTTGIKSPNYPFLQSSHIPFILDSKALMEAASANPAANNVLEDDVLVIFTRPAHHYVTPKFYKETKPATGKVVPTWNYAAAQVYGKARIYFENNDETSAYLQSQITDLTRHNETTTMGYTGGDRPTEWKVTDAPDKYVELLKRNIIGIEIEVNKLEGKFKMSQEMGKGDREGVIQGFENLENETGADIARTVRERGELKDSKQ